MSQLMSPQHDAKRQIARKQLTPSSWMGMELDTSHESWTCTTSLNEIDEQPIKYHPKIIQIWTVRMSISCHILSYSYDNHFKHAQKSVSFFHLSPKKLWVSMSPSLGPLQLPPPAFAEDFDQNSILPLRAWLLLFQEMLSWCYRLFG